METTKRYAGYRSFQYLEENVDYRDGKSVQTIPIIHSPLDVKGK